MDARPTTSITLSQKLAVVPLAEAKDQARVTFSDHDSLITAYIETAFDFLHGPNGFLNGYCLLEQTFEAYFSAAPDSLELPLRPVSAFTDFALSSLAADGSYAAIAPAGYATSLSDSWGIITRLGSTPYPLLAANPRAFKATFKAGNAVAADVPSPLKLAIKLLVTHWYENRSATMPDSRAGSISREVMFGLRHLCRGYRVSPDHS